MAGTGSSVAGTTAVPAATTAGTGPSVSGTTEAATTGPSVSVATVSAGTGSTIYFGRTMELNQHFFVITTFPVKNHSNRVCLLFQCNGRLDFHIHEL
jgi:hypothetical protein